MEQLGRRHTFRSDVPPGGVSEELTAGYILPVTLDGTEHLHMLTDGTLIVTQPHPTNETSYKNIFRPNEVPYDMGASSFAETKNQLQKLGGIWEATMINTSPDSSTHLHEVVDQAITTAVESKKQRDRARRETSGYLLDEMDRRLFGRPDSPGGEHDQSSEHPPEAPQ